LRELFVFAAMPPKPKVRNSDSKKESSANALVDNKVKDFFKRKRGDRKSSGSSDTSVSNSPKKIKAGASMEPSIEEEKMEHGRGHDSDSVSDFSLEDQVVEDRQTVGLDDEQLEKIIELFDQKMSVQVQNFRFETKALIKESLKSVQKINSDVFDLKQENDGLKADIRDLRKTQEDMLDQVRACTQRVGFLERKCVRLEQQSRKPNIRVFKMPEQEGENCKEEVVKLINEKLNVEMSVEALDAAHRLPETKTEKTPAAQVIVKFARRVDKRKVMANRKLLKGSGVSFADDLCFELVSLMNRIKKDDNVADVWQWEGRVFFRDKNNKVHRIEYGQSIVEAMNKRNNRR
jgi:hypothetical protein